MADIPVDILLRVRDEMSDALDRAANRASKFQAAAVALGTVAGGVALAGITAAAGAVSGLVTSMVEGNAQFERYSTQFGVLLGSAEAAKQRLAELAEFGATTPFELPEVVEADKILQAFGLHAIEAKDKFGFAGTEIRTIAGDVAAGSGAAFTEIAGYIGKFASGATGEAIARFQELGIVTRQELAGMGLEFSKSGELLSPLPQATEVLLTAMRKKFGGLMQAQSSTFEGMLSNLKDWIGQTTRELGQPIFEIVSDALKELLTFLSSEEVKGTIKAFAKDMANVLREVVRWVKDNWPTIRDVISAVFTAIKFLWENVLSPVLKILITVIGEIVKFVAANFPGVAKTISDAFEVVSSVWRNVLSPVFSSIIDSITRVIDFAGRLADALRAPFEALDRLRQGISQLDISGAIGNLFGGNRANASVNTNNFYLTANYSSQTETELRDDISLLQRLFGN